MSHRNFGLAFLVGLVAILLDKSLPHEIVIGVTLAYLLTLFSICFMLLRQVPKLIDTNLRENKVAKFEVVQPAQLSSPTTAQLEEPREPAISVTENTTRTLNEISVK